MVAVSPAFGTGDVDRLIGDGARSCGGGSWLTTALVSMMMKDLPYLEGRKSFDQGWLRKRRKGTSLPQPSRASATPPSSLRYNEDLSEKPVPQSRLLLSRKYLSSNMSMCTFSAQPFGTYTLTSTMASKSAQPNILRTLLSSRSVNQTLTYSIGRSGDGYHNLISLKQNPSSVPRRYSNGITGERIKYAQV